MNWRALLQESESIVSPWTGGRVLRVGPRTWAIEGPLPQEHGWAEFTLSARKARFLSQAEARPEGLTGVLKGYLVGDRLVATDARMDPDPKTIVAGSERVHLIDPGLDRFVLVSAGRTHEGGPLIFIQQEMSLGPEAEVLQAFLDQRPSVGDVRGVVPALDAAFRMEVWQRGEAEKRRQELEEQRRKEDEERQREERRREMVERLGDGAGRREMALVDFEGAARAALAVGGAQYLDHRVARGRDEVVVKFRMDGKRFECTCDRFTLRIIDAGICLTAHYDDPDFEHGTRGDNYFTLESLPPVIRQADRERRLVIFRHVD